MKTIEIASKRCSEAHKTLPDLPPAHPSFLVSYHLPPVLKAAVSPSPVMVPLSFGPLQVLSNTYPGSVLSLAFPSTESLLCHLPGTQDWLPFLYIYTTPMHTPILVFTRIAHLLVFLIILVRSRHQICPTYCCISSTLWGDLCIIDRCLLFVE